jgi:S1-C subfamily serine protease
MVDKEIADYVKVQRGLGVSDAAIKRSLLEAGYVEGEFAEALSRPATRTALKTEPVTTQHLLYMNIMIIVAFGILAIYVVYDYNAKLTSLSDSQQQKMNEMDTKVVSQLDMMRQDLSSRMGSIGNDVNLTRSALASMDSDLRSSIQEYNYQALVRDNALSDSIQKISNRSLSELSSFQEQLRKVSESAVDFAPIIQKALDAVVTIGRKDKGAFMTGGSGVLINNVGYIVTNYHVIDDIRSIVVKTHDDSEYTATVVGKEESWDIAVIKLVTEKRSFDYLGWADSDALLVGQHVIAVGNPIGLESTVTEGIISSTKRLITGERDIYYLQTDVAINAGSSGGPLIDEDGRIVGIATMKYSKLGFEGLSFALRSNDVQGVVMNILQEESVP